MNFFLKNHKLFQIKIKINYYSFFLYIIWMIWLLKSYFEFIFEQLSIFFNRKLIFFIF